MEAGSIYWVKKFTNFWTEAVAVGSEKGNGL